MKIIKPSLKVLHNGYKKAKSVPLMTVDFHPDGTRIAVGDFVTGLKLWDLPSLLNEKKPTLLCSIQSGGVKCVKFSPLFNGGAMLASGGENGSVFIWEKSESEGPVPFGETRSVESWTLCSQLTVGCDVDVFGVAWQPCPPGERPTLLASCSLDGFIQIWDLSLNKNVPDKCFKAHDGWALGLAWDPKGKYLASQGSDGAVKIWLTENWSEMCKIEEGFRNSQAPARISWTPDGSFLGTVAGKINNAMCSHNFARSTWEPGHRFVGHELSTCVTRYCPMVFQDEKDKYFTLCAVASLDQKVTVWSNAKALVVMNTFFKDAITDVAWMPRRPIMAITSMDGSLVLVEFTNKELGGSPKSHIPLEHQAAFPSVVPRDVSELRGQKDRRNGSKKKSRALDGNSQKSPSSQAVSPVKSASSALIKKTQVESKTSSGRRKIKPISMSDFTPKLPEGQAPPKITTEASPKQQRDPKAKGITKQQPKRRKTSTHQQISPQPSFSFPPPAADIPPPRPQVSTATAPLQSQRRRQRNNRLRFPPLQAKPRSSFSFDSSPATSLSSAKNTVVVSNSPSFASVEANDCSGRLVWSERLDSSNVVLCIGNNVFTSFFCIEPKQNTSRDCSSSFQVFSTASGRRLLPEVFLSSPVSDAAVGEDPNTFVVVSCDGMLRVFDVAQQRCIVKCSADPILPKASSGIGFGLTKLSLTSQHVPLLGFVDPGSKPSDAVGLSSIFAFHADLDAWMMISNSRTTRFPFMAEGQVTLKANPVESGAELDIHLLPMLNAQSQVALTELSLDAAMNMPSYNEMMGSLSNIESQVAMSKALQSLPEHCHWLKRYVEALVQACNSDGGSGFSDIGLLKLQEVCLELLGPLSPLDGQGKDQFDIGAQPRWQADMFGLSKRDFLGEEIIPLLKKCKCATSLYQRLESGLKQQSSKSDELFSPEKADELVKSLELLS